MSRHDVTIPTPDGEARASVFTPGHGSGPWPAVIFYMDALAIRPALFDMGERLASHGYYVLMPDMFWRAGPCAPMNPVEVFSDPAKREHLLTRMSSTNPDRAMRDTGCFLDWLALQPLARADKVGMTGYCMGGAMALRAAAAYPDRTAAVGAFHAGNVVTDQPDSPHRQVGGIKAKVLIAGADQDQSFTDENLQMLQKTMAEAGVDAEVTIYRGAAHGYAPADTPAYDREHSERHWRELLALFRNTLH